MSSNFEWQKRQANEHVQLRLQEATEHRRARQGQVRASFSRSLRMIIPVLVGLIIAIWLLTGCTSADDSVVEANTAVKRTGALTIADRIRFQDKLEADLGAETDVSNVAELTMAARIQFQDKREFYLEARTALPTQTTWTMADRIRFHDRMIHD